MGKEAPKSQNYTAAATDQAKAEAGANRPNQATPWAQSQWTMGPDGQMQQSVGFAGPMAGAADSLQNQAAQNMSQPMDWSQFGQMTDGSAARDQAIEAAYGQATSRLNPQWAQRDQLASSGLANQGLDPNSQAYRNAMRQHGQQRNDAYGSAMNSAIMQGQAAGDSVFRNNMMSRQQMIAEALRQRGQPMSEMQQLSGFLQMPGFQSVQGPQLLNAAMAGDQYNLNAWNMQNQANADAWTGGMKAVGSVAAPIAMALSDERAKENIKRLDIEAMPGVPFATWTYKSEHGGAHAFGVIAQDLLRVDPSYVSKGEDGLLRVDYSFLLEEA